MPPFHVFHLFICAVNPFLSPMPRPFFFTMVVVVFCAGLFAVGLWPFNFRAKNHAMLSQDGAGLRFDAPVQRSHQDLGGMVFTASPLSCRSKEGCEAATISIALELRADNEPSGCIPRILEVRRPDGSEAFYLGQWESALIVRSFNTPAGGGKPYREMGVAGVLRPGRTSIIAITSGPGGTDFFLDGRKAENFPGARLLRADETLEGHSLYLGNSPNLSCPWAGSILALALFSKAWTPLEAISRQDGSAGSSLNCGNGRVDAIACYRFEGPAGEWIVDTSGSGNDLWKPGILVFEKRFLGMPSMRSFPLSDLAVNLAGFVPFGFMVCLRLLIAKRLSARTCILLSLAAGFAVSLGIETVQVWLPGRDSSMPDLLANSMGAFIGGAACFKAKRLWEVCLC